MKPRSEPELTAKWIIEHVLNTSALLDRLERAGLIERRPDPKGRRGKLIALTGAGRRLVANKERLLSALTQAGQETLDALLRKLIAGL